MKFQRKGINARAWFYGTSFNSSAQFASPERLEAKDTRAGLANSTEQKPETGTPPKERTA